MSFEELKLLWDNQPIGPVALPDDRTVLEKVKADSHQFDVMIRDRDRRELRAGLKFTMLFFVAGVIPHQAGVWPFFAAAGCMLFVTLFLLGEKALAAWRGPKEDDTLVGGVARARDHVRRQVWLLRHVLWWYLIPAQMGWALFGLGVAFRFVHSWPLVAHLLVLGFWVVMLVHGTVKVYRLNQNAVRDDLLPRLAQLDDLLAKWRQKDSTVTS